MKLILIFNKSIILLKINNFKQLKMLNIKKLILNKFKMKWTNQNVKILNQNYKLMTNKILMNKILMNKILMRMINTDLKIII